MTGPARLAVPPPYYAVIFSNQRTEEDADAYGEAAGRMMALAPDQPGFLGVESVRGADGFGITVSYWVSEDAIEAWKAHAEHTEVRQQGRKSWYQSFALRVAVVERAYDFTR